MGLEMGQQQDDEIMPWYESEVTQLEGAILALHAADQEGQCLTCTEKVTTKDEIYWQSCDYPCPTVTLIKDAHGG